MGRGQTNRQTDKHPCRQINTMTRPGLVKMLKSSMAAVLCENIINAEFILVTFVDGDNLLKSNDFNLYLTFLSIS